MRALHGGCRWGHCAELMSGGRPLPCTAEVAAWTADAASPAAASQAATAPLVARCPAELAHQKLCQAVAARLSARHLD